MVSRTRLLEKLSSLEAERSAAAAATEKAQDALIELDVQPSALTASTIMLRDELALLQTNHASINAEMHHVQSKLFILEGDRSPAVSKREIALEDLVGVEVERSLVAVAKC